MASKQFTYGFLGLMIIALITLAVLQYQWLGSISESEEMRLQESLGASTENFVADLNQVFSQMNELFRIQITQVDETIDTRMGEAYLNWLSNSNYPNLVDELYYIKDVSGESEVLLFNSDPLMLTPVSIPEDVAKWLGQQKESSQQVIHSAANNYRAELGDPSFLAIPVQLLDVINMENFSTGGNVRVQLSVDQLNDVVLIKLDDEILKERVIEDIARTYFSDSFRDQYSLSLVKASEEDTISYYNSSTEPVTDPDFSKNLRQIRYSSVLVFKETMEGSGSSAAEISSALDSMLQTVSSLEVNRVIDEESYEFSTQHQYRTAGDSTGFSSTWNYELSGDNVDTVIGSTFYAGLNEPVWQLWLSFKDGSLEQFVANTRLRNLAISFGILGILGISVVLIVIFAQRSRELADKQMLFVAGVSHELRTPLTVIRSAAENLSEGVIQDQNRQKEYARLMLKEGRRLSDMVDQIMEFSGIQSGKKIYQFTRFEIQEFMEQVIQECKPGLDEKDLKLEYSINTDKNKIISADRDALMLAVFNLLQNAMKFSSTGQKIILRCFDIEDENKRSVCFQVQDFGTGIEEDEQKMIFEPFSRGRHSVENQIKGNGIGLSLVDKVVKAHSGKVKLKSKPGNGSTFTIIIPESHGS